MNKNGIAFPNIIDLVTSDTDVCKLIVVQEEYISKDDTLALQTKINNYLAYGLDGQLLKEYPDCKGKRLLIQINLFQMPDPFVFEFIEKARAAVEQAGASLKIEMLE